MPSRLFFTFPQQNIFFFLVTFLKDCPYTLNRLHKLPVDRPCSFQWIPMTLCLWLPSVLESMFCPWVEHMRIAGKVIFQELLRNSKRWGLLDKYPMSLTPCWISLEYVSYIFFEYPSQEGALVICSSNLLSHAHFIGCLPFTVLLTYSLTSFFLRSTPKYTTYTRILVLVFFWENPWQGILMSYSCL